MGRKKRFVVRKENRFEAKAEEEQRARHESTKACGVLTQRAARLKVRAPHLPDAFDYDGTSVHGRVMRRLELSTLRPSPLDAAFSLVAPW